MKVPYIDLVGQHRKLRPELLKALNRVLDRGDFVLGREVVELEKKFAKY